MIRFGIWYFYQIPANFPNSLLSMIVFWRCCREAIPTAKLCAAHYGPVAASWVGSGASVRPYPTLRIQTAAPQIGLHAKATQDIRI